MTSPIDASTNTLPRVARTPFYYGWVVLVVAALASFASGPGQTFTFSVFQDSFIEDLSLSSTSVSTLYLFGSLTAAGLIILIGRSLDRFGPRIMMVFAVICLGLGALWISQVDTPWQLFVGFAIMRTMGQGALSLIPTTVVSVWFVRKRPMALALMALGGAIASGIYPFYGASLIEYFGWRTAWIVIAITGWVILIVPAIVFIRTSPESIGLKPDGDSNKKTSDTKLNDQGKAQSEFVWTAKQAVRSRVMWLLIFAGSAQSLVGTGVAFQQISIMTSKDLSIGAAAGVFGIMAPAAIAGQFIAGYLASRIPVRYLIAAGQAGLVVAMIMLLGTNELWQAYAYGVVLGTIQGFLMNLNQVVWPAYFGRKHLGSIKGIANFGMMASAAIGPLPLALSIDQTGSYTIGLIGYMVLPPLCGIAAVFAGKPRRPSSQLRMQAT
ncbi:MAG: MFS transporter [Dehalococcoidia bacterium]|nr:MFS transporter [Dehalococcoidia bacterium]